MCAIIGWSGQLPVGLLHQLLLAAEPRGRHSTGVAYWDEELNQNYVVKQAVPAKVFAKINAERLKMIGKSRQGIAHTRNASPRMPINNLNAHPFVYDSYAFAHNGVVTNWRTIRDSWLELEKDDPLYRYASKIETDSMVLGPCIKNLDFESVTGCMGLVWLNGTELFVLRSMKEATAARLEWHKTNNGGATPNTAHIVASTWHIIESALARVKNVEYTATEIVLDENQVYKISADGVTNQGAVPVSHQNKPDAYTSTCAPAGLTKIEIDVASIPGLNDLSNQ